MATAIEVIRDKGLDCSIDDIARKVGVSRPIIYRFFESRDGLVKAVGVDTVQRVRASMLEAMAGQTTARGIVSAGIDTYLRFIEDEPQLYRYLVHGRSGERVIASSDFAVRLSREIAVVLGDLLEENGHDTGMAEPWAMAIIGMVGVSGEWWLNRGALSRRRLTDYLTRLVWDGISSVTTSSQTDELAPRRNRRAEPEEHTS